MKNKQIQFKQTEVGLIPENWKVLKFGDVASFRYGKMPKKSKISKNGYPIYTGYRIVGNYSQYMYDDPQLIVVARGVGGTGDVKISPPKCWITNLSIIAGLDEKVIDKRFLKYYFHKGLKQLDSGSAQSQITINDLNNIELGLPPIEEQKKIAEVLGALDDKIELNRKMNKTLEFIGQTIFKYIFCHSGLDPESRKPLKYFGQIVCGKTPSKSKSEYFGGEIPFIKIPDMHGQTFILRTEDSLTEKGINSQAKKTVPAGSICTSCIATVGLVSITSQESQTNQQINSIITNMKELTYYVYFALKNIEQDIKDMASGGSATLNLNTGHFSNIEIPMPSNKELQDFDKKIRPIFEEILINSKQTGTLSQIRDSLLPRLMSGKLRII